MTRDSMPISMYASRCPQIGGAPARVHADRASSVRRRTKLRGRREGDDPIHEFAAPMPQLSQAAHAFHPAEDLLDQFAFLLADAIARVARHAAVDRTAFDLLRDGAAQGQRGGREGGRCGIDEAGRGDEPPSASCRRRE